MPSSFSQRAFNAYIRAEGDEADIIQMCQAALYRGIVLSPLEAFVIWQWYSDTCYSAGWMTMDDHGIERALSLFFKQFDTEYTPDA